MTESRDRKTGIIRHEYSTVSPSDCRKNIEVLECIKQKYYGNNVNRYIAELNGAPIEIRSTPTRTIIFGMDRKSMLEIAGLLNYEEWEYDNTTPRTDYMGVGK